MGDLGRVGGAAGGAGRDVAAPGRGARAAALYAKEARDAVNALAAKIQQPPAVDVKALAAALAPLLTAGATADQIATAVVSHLATTLAKG